MTRIHNGASFEKLLVGIADSVRDLYEGLGHELLLMAPNIEGKGLRRKSD
jgi:hypothetical protein